MKVTNAQSYNKNIMFSDQFKKCKYTYTEDSYNITMLQ